MAIFFFAFFSAYSDSHCSNSNALKLSTWSFMIATSRVTMIIVETRFLCNALISQLGKTSKIKLFPNPLEE